MPDNFDINERMIKYNPNRGKDPENPNACFNTAIKHNKPVKQQYGWLQKLGLTLGLVALGVGVYNLLDSINARLMEKGILEQGKYEWTKTQSYFVNKSLSTAESVADKVAKKYHGDRTFKAQVLSELIEDVARVTSNEAAKNPNLLDPAQAEIFQGKLNDMLIQDFDNIDIGINKDGTDKIKSKK